MTGSSLPLWNRSAHELLRMPLWRIDGLHGNRNGKRRHYLGPNYAITISPHLPRNPHSQLESVSSVVSGDRHGPVDRVPRIAIRRVPLLFLISGYLFTARSSSHIRVSSKDEIAAAHPGRAVFDLERGCPGCPGYRPTYPGDQQVFHRRHARRESPRSLRRAQCLLRI